MWCQAAECVRQALDHAQRLPAVGYYQTRCSVTSVTSVNSIPRAPSLSPQFNWLNCGESGHFDSQSLQEQVVLPSIEHLHRARSLTSDRICSVILWRCLLRETRAKSQIELTPYFQPTLRHFNQIRPAISLKPRKHTERSMKRTSNFTPGEPRKYWRKKTFKDVVSNWVRANTSNRNTLLDAGLKQPDTFF